MDIKIDPRPKKLTLNLLSMVLAIIIMAVILPSTVRAADREAGQGTGSQEAKLWGSEPGSQAPRLSESLRAHPEAQKVLMVGDTYELNLNNSFYDDDSSRAALTYYVKKDNGSYQEIPDKYSYTYRETAKEGVVTLSFKASDGVHESSVYQVILKYYQDPSRVPPLEWIRYKVGTAGVTIVDCEEIAPKLDIPDYIEGKPVTNIGVEAFYGCSKLTEIRLPSTLKTIGNQAFQFCTALKKINLPEGLNQVGEGAFRECSSLAEINLPASLQEFRMNIFEGCRNIHFIVAPDNPRYTCRDGVIYDHEMTTLVRAGVIDSGRLVIPDSVTEIRAQAFLNNPLKSIVLGQKIKIIGEDAFKGCSRLEEAVLNDGLESIGAGTFEGTTALKEIRLPESLTSLGKAVFKDSGLELMDLAKIRLSTLPYGTFEGCTRLRDISLSDRITVIEDAVFSHCPFQEITLPAKLQHLGSGCFSCCNFETITIPYTLKELGSNVFADCNSLKTVYFEGNMPLRGGQIGGISSYPRENDSFAQLPLDTAKALKIKVLQGVRGWGDSFMDFADGYPAGPTKMVPFEYNVDYYTLNELKEEPAPRLILQAPESFIGLEIGASSEAVGVIKAGLPAEGGQVVWSSSDRSVAAVDEKGRVTALSEGASVITAAYAYNEGVYTGEVKVNVVGPTIFDWTVQSDGTVMINGFKEGTEELSMRYLEIPETMAGYPVTAIKSNAFKLNPNIISVKIPGGVRTIGSHAFYYCVQLREVTLEEGIEKIGDGAFQGTDIRTVVVPRSVTTGASVNTPASALTDVFKDCEKLESAVIMAENLKNLSGTFQDCISLKNVTLGEGIKSLGGSFQGCTALESITLPATIQRINGAFRGCTGLRTVELQGYLSAEDMDDNPFAGYDRVFRMPYESSWISMHYEDCSEDLVVLHPDDGNDWGSLFNNQVKTGIRISAGDIKLDRDSFNGAWSNTGSVIEGKGTVINAVNMGAPSKTAWNTALDKALASDPASASDSGVESADGRENERTDRKEEATVFEIVKKAVVENPMATVAVGAIILGIILLGGAGRYRRYKENG